MSCTSLSPGPAGGESDCSRDLTCALWDTNAFSSCAEKATHGVLGAKAQSTPNNRLQRTALPRRR